MVTVDDFDDDDLDYGNAPDDDDVNVAWKERSPVLVEINAALAEQFSGAMPFVGLRYDYSTIERTQRPHIMAAALTIRAEGAKARESIFEIGKQLLIAKQLLPHGQFGEWLKTEFDMSERTAQNMMRVAEVFGAKSANVAVFSDSVLYMLAAPSTPPEVREKVEVTFRQTGELPTRKEIKSLRDEHQRTKPVQGKAVYATPMPKPEVAPMAESAPLEAQPFDATLEGRDREREELIATGRAWQPDAYPEPDAPTAEELAAIVEVEAEREEEEAQRLEIDGPLTFTVPPVTPPSLVRAMNLRDALCNAHNHASRDAALTEYGLTIAAMVASLNEHIAQLEGG
jgi:hypothetical protein